MGNHLIGLCQRPGLIANALRWGAQRLRPVLRPKRALLSYKAKCHPYFSVHSLDIQRSTKAQHSPLLTSEQSRSSAGVSATKTYGESDGFTALLHHWMFWGSTSPLQSWLYALDNGTLEERVSWLQSTGPRAWTHHFHPGIAPQRTGKFSRFGNAGLERISCHWQAALFLHRKCNWNRVPTFTPISHLTSSKLP